MPQSEKRAMVDRFIAAYNAFDIEGMAALLHPSVVFRNVAGGRVNVETAGISEFKALAKNSAGFFSVREQKITSYREEGDSAFTEIIFTATTACDFPHGPSKGTEISIPGRSEYVFTGGLISGITDISGTKEDQ